EAPELLTGAAQYAADITLPGMVWAHLVRSPCAHATIKNVGASKATSMPGVVAVFTGPDLATDWPAPLIMVWPPTEDTNNPSHWPLAKDKVRHVGDPVAVVVAESRAAAADAAEAVQVDYEPLAPVRDMDAAPEEGRPL